MYLREDHAGCSKQCAPCRFGRQKPTDDSRSGLMESGGDGLGWLTKQSGIEADCIMTLQLMIVMI